MTRIGKTVQKIAVFWCFLAALPQAVSWAEVRATLEPNEVTLGESVALKFTATQDEDLDNIHYQSPGLRFMNRMESSSYSMSMFNGRVQQNNVREVTIVLDPERTGTLKIFGIRVGSQSLPDQTVVVRNENYQANTPRIQDEAPSLQGDAKYFFIRSEASKTKVFKGEQIIVSFYLYRRTQAAISEVLQYPSFQGFIREDLEMPVLSPRGLEFEAVSLGGVPFERALLARYALNAIKDGKLRVEPFSTRVEFIPKARGGDDPFAEPFFQFFNQITPRRASAKSDPLTIEVLPLPDGKSPAFTGGIGDFEVSREIPDEKNLKSHTPFAVRFTFKGRGSAQLIELPPNLPWPASFKVFPPQSQSKSLGQGLFQKTIEILVSSSETGKVTLPEFNFEFFNPESKSYSKKTVPGIDLFLGQGDTPSGNPTDFRATPTSEQGATAGTTWALLPQKTFDGATAFKGVPWWRYVFWVGCLMFLGFLGLVFWDQFKKKTKIKLDLRLKQQRQTAQWAKLDREIRALRLELGLKADRVSSLVQEAIDLWLDALYEKSHIEVRALTRHELKSQGLAAGWFTEAGWSEIEDVLSFSEQIRYSGQIQADEILLDRAENAVKQCRDWVELFESGKVG